MFTPHPFLRLPRGLQICLAALFALAYALPLGVLAFALVQSPTVFPLTLPALFILPVIESVFLTPLFIVVGRFKYLSPFMLYTGGGRAAIDLHAGTLFDYLIGLRTVPDRGTVKLTVAIEMLQGLIELGRRVDTGTIAPSQIVRATTYFFSARTLALIGMEEVEPPSNAVLNLRLAVLSIALRLSIARGELTWPDLSKVKAGETTAGRIAGQVPALTRVLERLRRRYDAV